ncbi:MAG: ABC-F family ATP-binding cassette domain-containing protein, partial [Rhizobiales bacterium]|nr:ABC-F family ATP-binding cassette domain-containing protein [Hyphomicrobiales bacterium]
MIERAAPAISRPSRWLADGDGGVMLTVSNLSKSFGDRSLFEGVSFSVNPHDRVGLIGVNGSGKSTLLALIARELASDAGSIWLEPGATIGYLRQGFADRADADLAQLLNDATGGLTAASTRVDQALAVLADATNPDALHEYDESLATFDAAGGYQRLAELEELLGKLKVDHL